MDKLEYVEEDGKKSDPETAIVKASEKSDAPVAEDTIDAATVDELNQQQPPKGNKSVVKLNSKYVLYQILLLNKNRQKSDRRTHNALILISFQIRAKRAKPVGQT